MEMVDLAKIEVATSNPHVLFNEWFNDAEKNLPFALHRAMNVATVSKDGVVSNRTVYCQEIEEDGILFNTDKNGRKSREIREHPQVSATLYWYYEKDGRHLQRQVRLEGNANSMDRSVIQRQFDNAPMVSKVRSMFCNQDEVVEWEDLSRRHKLVMEAIKTKEITLDDNPNLVVFKIIPNRMEFYHAYTDAVGDRVAFTKNETGWECVHLEP